MKGHCFTLPGSARERIVLIILSTFLLSTTAAFSVREIKGGRLEHAGSTYCRPLTDLTGATFLVKMQDVGSSTEDVFAHTRSSMGIPAVAKSAIVGVTDEAKCQLASEAIDSAKLGAPLHASLYLVAVGTHYMALPPTDNALIVHLDSRFTVKNEIVQQ